MAEAAVRFLSEKLAKFIHEEYSLLGGIREDAEDINNALDGLKAALRVAEEKEEIDPQVQAWLKKVRELAYDTEDVLDEFLFYFGGRQSSGGFCCKIQSIYNLRARRRIALALRTIKDKLNHSEYRPTYPYPQSSTHIVQNYNEQLDYSRGNALLLEESDLVGIEKSKQSLVNLLLGTVDDDLKVHCLVGMGGLGKTTLVKQAYDDTKVIKHFQYRVWVTVSETFKIMELLKNATEQLVEQTNQDYSHKDFDAMDSTQLKEFVRNILSGRRYIIILDDVWGFDVWQNIKCAFPRQNFGSRIVITTRNREIGLDACHETQGVVYPMKPLSPKDSWVLFCKKIFLCDSCPPHLVNISKNILKRCDGLPLAIMVVAGVLATKSEDIAEWEIFQNSLQLESNGRMKNFKNLISLSYYDLPYYLKYCFLYFSIFPENAIIEKRRVIQLWIAEGFVKDNRQQVKEQVAEAYLNELIHRNLIQVAEKSHAGRVIGLRIHDILRELILFRALEQNFASIVTRQNKEWSSNCRRLIIHTLDNDILKSTSSKTHLRSLQLFTSKVVLSSLPNLLSFDYIPLKVLDLRGTELETIPAEVFKLFHLKYLSLRGTRLSNVPKSIRRLKNLEILDLKYTLVNKLPVEIVKLHKLRHLMVGSYCGFNAPFKIGGLSSLQKLCCIRANKTNRIRVVSEIGHLTQLRKLGVIDLRQEDGKELCLSLEKLTNICSLSLKSAKANEILDIQHSLSEVPLCLRKLNLYESLERVPQWLSSLVSLTKLELVFSYLIEDPLPFLQDLPMLVHLDLYKSYKGEGLCFKAGKFSKLKYLSIQRFPELKWIMVEEGSAPLLEELVLVGCEKLEQVPLGVEHLSKLNSITFLHMSLNLSPNGENYTRISHIPRIHVTEFVNGVGKFLLKAQEI